MKTYLPNLSKKKILKYIFELRFWMTIVIPMLLILAISLTISLSKHNEKNAFENLLSNNLPFLIYNVGLLAVLTILFRIFTFIFFTQESKVKTKLKNKIITIFTTITVVPCALVAMFAILFLNNNMQQWFNNNMSKTITQAATICEGYIAKNQEMLMEAALNYANQIDQHTITPEVLEQQITKTNLYGIFAHSMVFTINPFNVIASTDSVLSAFSIENIPYSQIKHAKKNTISVFEISTNTLCAVVQLKHNQDAYLAITQTLDEKMVDYVNKTKGAVNHYHYLKDQLQNIQIRFATLFVLTVVMLMFASIIIGVKFANQITFPIQNLVLAARAIRDGDLSTQVPLTKTKDEITLLALTFNDMVKTLNKQEKAIASAQKEIIWSDLAKKVAHEINNPLTPIQLSTEKILKQSNHQHVQLNKPNPFKPYLTNILKNVDNIKDIISAFSYFGKLPNIQLEKIDIIECIKVAIQERTILQSKILYDLQYNQDSMEVMCDKKQIVQVINNIFLNAEQNFESTIVKNPTIQTYVVTFNNKLKIIIKDNGSGFSKEILNQDITPYLTTKSFGTGLGLTIAKKIIEDHQGNIKLCNHVKDNKIKGAIITITFKNYQRMGQKSLRKQIA